MVGYGFFTVQYSYLFSFCIYLLPLNLLLRLLGLSLYFYADDTQIYIGCFLFFLIDIIINAYFIIKPRLFSSMQSYGNYGKAKILVCSAAVVALCKTIVSTLNLDGSIITDLGVSKNLRIIFKISLSFKKN